MIKLNGFVNIGSRNKGVMWEHLTACAYRDMEVPGSAYKLTKLLSFGEGETNQHCLYADEMHSNTELMIREAEEGIYTPGFFEKVRESYQKPLVELKEAVSRVPAAKATDQELLALYDQFYVSAGRTYPPMLIGLFSAYLDEYFTKILTDTIPLGGIELITVKTNLLTMPRESFTEREDEALSRLVREIKSNPSISARGESELLADKIVGPRIGEITKKFGWFHMEYAGLPRPIGHYARLLAQKLDESAPEKDMAGAKKEVIAFQEKFFSTHKNDKLRYVTSVMQELAFILDDSKAVTVENHFVIYPVFEELATRLSISVADLYLLSQDELHDALTEKKAGPDMLSARKKCRLILLDGESLGVYSGSEAKELAEKYIEVPKVSSSNEVKGIVAYPGYYRGTVRHILNANEYGAFKDGDVLVTRDGSAEFTYFLQHAGAVVCDQGGIISHAAIVARESKIPTILGTKVATKVLHDGDMVEVDANTGVVRILKRDGK